MSSGKRILAGTAIAVVVIAGLGYGGTLWVQRSAACIELEDAKVSAAKLVRLALAVGSLQ